MVWPLQYCTGKSFVQPDCLSDEHVARSDSRSIRDYGGNRLIRQREVVHERFLVNRQCKVKQLSTGRVVLETNVRQEGFETSDFSLTLTHTLCTVQHSIVQFLGLALPATKQSRWDVVDGGEAGLCCLHCCPGGVRPEIADSTRFRKMAPYRAAEIAQDFCRASDKAGRRWHNDRVLERVVLNRRASEA